MAGSLSHITSGNGEFQMDLIENLGDAHEALEECFHIIQVLAGKDCEVISAVCKNHGYPDPYREEK